MDRHMFVMIGVLSPKNLCVGNLIPQYSGVGQYWWMNFCLDKQVLPFPGLGWSLAGRSCKVRLALTFCLYMHQLALLFCILSCTSPRPLPQAKELLTHALTLQSC